MGTDPVSTDLPLVAPMTADEMVDHNQKLRDAIKAATIQRDNHVQKTAEQIREDQLNAESERLAAQLAAIQADAAEREIPLTGIAAMKAAAAAEVLSAAAEPIVVPSADEEAAVPSDVPDSGTVDTAELTSEAMHVQQIPATDTSVDIPVDDTGLPVTNEVTE